jgi:hypothetical protein
VAQHLEGSGHGVAVDVAFGAVLGFKDDLGAAAQVEAEAGGSGGGQPAGRSEHEEHGDQTPPKVTRQRGTSSVSPRRIG